MVRLPIVARKTSLPVDAAGIGICVAVSLIAYSVGFAPLALKRSFIVAQSRELETKRKECSELGASAASLASHLAGIEEELARNEIKLQSADRINERVAELAALLGECELEVDDVRLGQLLTGIRCEASPIRVAGRGTYKRCVAFMHKLCKTFPDSSLVRFELRGNAAGSQSTDPEALRDQATSGFSFELLWYTAPNIDRTPSNEAAASEGFDPQMLSIKRRSVGPTC